MSALIHPNNASPFLDEPFIMILIISRENASQSTDSRRLLNEVNM